MCLVVYAASSVPLPAVPWDPDAPAFHVEPWEDRTKRTKLAAWEQAAQCVRDHFSRPHVAYVGSCDGCGCAFGFEDPPSDGRPAELMEDEERAEHGALADYLAPLLAAGAEIELYACWSGEEDQPPALVMEASLATIRSRALVERGLCRLRPIPN